MSKEFLQRTVMLSLTSLILVVFLYNQKLSCMDREENGRHIAGTKAFHLLPDEIEVFIFSFLDQWDLLKRPALVSKSWRKATEKVWKFKPLDLSWNNIGAEGVKYIANGKLSSLIRLNLCYNIIGDEGKAGLKERFGAKVIF